MKVNSSINVSPRFTSVTDSKPEATTAQTAPEKATEKPVENSSKDAIKKAGFLDKFETGIINSADLNDTVQVPRTIFKGYLAFFAGTTLPAIGAIIKKKAPKITTVFNVASALLLIYGTFSFVRPYIIKNSSENKVK